MPGTNSNHQRPTGFEGLMRAGRARFLAMTGRTRIVLAAAAVVLVALAVGLTVVGLRGQVSAPQPPAAAAVPVPLSTSTSSATPSSAAPSVPVYTPPPSVTITNAAPMSITIPAIHVQSSLMQLGRNADGTVQVPPLSDVAQAGWYKYSPIPGNTGPAVILGHIDSAQAGKGVFFDLGELRPGNTVTVTRADHMIATFTVSKVLESPKTAFPASEVYGNTVDPELRLITCGGTFDPSIHSYEDNILVFASLTSLKPS